MSSEFNLPGNRISFTLPVSEKEHFLLNRYVWSTAAIEGKDTPITKDNNTSIFLRADAFHVEMQFAQETSLQAAFDLAVQKRNELQTWVGEKMEPFWAARKSWEAGIDNLMAAIGLAEKFEGGET